MMGTEYRRCLGSTQEVWQRPCMSCMYVCMYVCTTGTYNCCARPDYSARESSIFFVSCSPPMAGYWYQLSRRKERWGSRRGTHLYPLGTIPAPKIPKLSMALMIRWGSSIGNTRKRQNDQSNRRYFVPFCLYTSKATVAPKAKKRMRYWIVHIRVTITFACHAYNTFTIDIEGRFHRQQGSNHEKMAGVTPIIRGIRLV
ncbi:hypothetical protein BDV27DRAFT_133918 [Aspergillus caelatus]|uniref:Uncharacterized protein n=1 Tax=Aspergillus caelatus TaxID=61420 RepID=A0A5N6ZX41_9EURO|nr:uncharacterized protein BDV27DRAFT_133918 [Aspergillus caelatus]KAE8360830.1 hypothetical protein BDV27DRAFT_133918 [Aspergillus caelatus]